MSMQQQPTLKSLTWDLHKKAETTPLMKLLLKNEISDCLYCDLVYTKYLIYGAIENVIQFRTADLARKNAAFADWQTMGCSLPKCLPALETMLAHLRTLSEQQLWAHVYVHYLANVYGGQIIARVIGDRFPTSMYHFADPDVAKQEIRSHLTVDMAPEANRSFEMTINYYNQLYESHQ